MAKGRPPNAGLMSARQIESMLRRNNPKLKPEEGFSQGLCDLVVYVLELKPERRPSMDDVLEHPYIYETEKTHPTATLRQLIRVYEDWASSGGQRQSLIQPSGAAAAEFPEDDSKDLGDWRFSVVSIGDSAYDNVDNQIPSFHLDPAMDPTMDLELAQREENNLNSLIPESSYTPEASPRLPSNLANHTDDDFDPSHGITMKTTASEEMRIQGVRARFGDLFEGAGYSGSEATQSAQPSRPRSDLQLRNDASESDASQKENRGKKSNFRGTPVDTARANQSKQPGERSEDRDARRGTLLQTWDFDSASRTVPEPQTELAHGPSVIPDWNQNTRIPHSNFDDLGAPGDDVQVAGHPYSFPSRPALHHYATAPVEPPMLHNNFETATSRQTLDLDALMNEGTFNYNAPSSQQHDYQASSTQQDNASPPYQSYATAAGSAVTIDTHGYGYNAPSSRNDYHVDEISPATRPEDDQFQYATITGHPNTNGTSSYDLTERAHGTYNGALHTPTDSFNGSTPEEIARPSPPSAAAMAGGAPTEVIEAEVLRLSLGWERALRSAAEIWGDDSMWETEMDGAEDDGDDHPGLEDS